MDDASTKFLRGRGYSLDLDKLTKMYEASGLNITENVIFMHKIDGVFMIDAYNAGREGKPLASVAPWLVKE